MTNGDGRDTRADLIQRLRAFVSEFPPARLARTSPAIREAVGLIGEALAALDADATQGAMRKRRVSTLLADIVRVKNSELDSLRERLEQEIARLRERLSVLEPPALNYNRTLARAEKAEADVDRLRRERDALREALKETIDALASEDRFRHTEWHDNKQPREECVLCQDVDSVMARWRAALASAADAPREEK